MQHGNDLYKGSASPQQGTRGEGRRAELGQGCAGGRPGKGQQHCLGLGVPIAPGWRRQGTFSRGCPAQLQPSMHLKIPRVSLCRRRHCCWSQHCAESGQGVPCSAPFFDGCSILRGCSQGSSHETSQGPNVWRCCSHDVRATAHLLPALAPHSLPTCRTLSQPSQVRCRPQDNPPYLCRQGEGVGRVVSMPCCCLAAAGEGRGGVQRGAARGGGQRASCWSTARPHSTMVLRQDVTSATSCKQKSGKTAPQLVMCGLGPLSHWPLVREGAQGTTSDGSASQLIPKKVSGQLSGRDEPPRASGQPPRHPQCCKPSQGCGTACWGGGGGAQPQLARHTQAGDPAVPATSISSAFICAEHLQGAGAMAPA